jgi:16S rRNA processing protein RimM
LLDHKNFIAIGKIVRPIGIKGNLKVIYLTDFPERFNKLQKILLFDEKKGEFHSNNIRHGYDFIISWCKLFDRFVNIKFEGYDEINKSKDLVNLVLMVNEKERVKLSEGYYFYELIGLDVYDKDNYLGQVDKISNYGSGDLFSVLTKGKEILIPYKKEFIKKIDTNKKRIDVDLIDGFIE